MRKILASFQKRLEWRFVHKEDISKFKYQEIDPQTYYTLGGISISGNHWMDYYMENDMATYPSATTLKESKYSLPRKTFETDVKRLGNPYLTSYSKCQAIPLREIQIHLTVRIIGENLFQDDNGWIKTGIKIRRFFKSAIPFLQQRMNNYYFFLNFYNKLLDIRTDMFFEAQRIFQESIKSGFTSKEAYKDRNSNIQRQEKNKIPIICKDVFTNLSLTIKQVTEWQGVFAKKSYWTDPTIYFFDYIENIPTYTKEKSKGDFRLALDCYTIAKNIEWFLRMLGEKPVETRYLVLERGYKICPYCNEIYSLRDKKRNKKSCGKPKCVQANSNQRKKEMRNREYKK